MVLSAFCLFVFLNVILMGTAIYNESYIWKIALSKRNYMENKSDKEILQSWGILDIIQEKLNFKYEFVKPIAELVISINEAGKYSGSFGKVVNKEADIGFMVIYVTYDRFLLADFTSTVFLSPVNFMLLKPKSKIFWYAMFKPFSLKIWLAIIAAVFIYGFALYLLINPDKKSNRSTGYWSLKKIFWFLFGTLNNQGGDLKAIQRISCRMAIGIWILSAFILVSSYSGCLMSFLTAPVPDPVPTTFEQLAAAVKSGRYDCAVYSNVAANTYIMESKIGPAVILKDHMRSKKGFFPHNEDNDIIELVKKGNFAIISGLRMLIDLQENCEECIISDDTLVTFDTAFAIRKDFPYKKEVDNLVSYLYQSGISKKRFGVKNNNEIIKQQEILPLKLQELEGPFFLLITGYMLSFICFIVEFMNKNVPKCC